MGSWLELACSTHLLQMPPYMRGGIEHGAIYSPTIVKLKPSLRVTNSDWYSFFGWSVYRCVTFAIEVYHETEFLLLQS